MRVLSVDHVLLEAKDPQVSANNNMAGLRSLFSSALRAPTLSRVWRQPKPVVAPALSCFCKHFS